jgi:hypothetical protein
MTKIISIVGGLQPSAPTIGTATAGDTTASVAFTPSTYIGKGTITYTATSSPGGFTGTASSSPITVSGLSNGTAYTFTVVGNTNYGVASLTSAASNSITPAPSSVLAYESIASIAITSGNLGTITFNALGSYEHLQIRGSLISAGSNGDPYFTTNLGNNSSGINQKHGGTEGSSGVFANTPSNPNRYLSWATNYNNTNPMSFVMDILNYRSTTQKKIIRGQIGIDRNGSGMAFFNTHLLDNTSPLTSISFQAFNNDYGTGTYIGVYGIKGVI